MTRKIKTELFLDNFQNYKRYGIPKAQLVIADIPYNLGNNAYGSNPMWYVGGDNKNGESKKAGKGFFNTDFNFNIAEYFHFCNRLLKKEPKEKGKAPCMIVFCSFEQMPTVIEYAKKHGFKNYIPLTFIKNYSAQVLKANMRIVGATEYALVLYRDKLPKFNNGRKYDENGKVIRGTGKMMFDWSEWKRNKTEYSERNYNERTCAICGGKFLSRRKEAKYCSDDCRNEVNRIAEKNRRLRNYYKNKEK